MKDDVVYVAEVTLTADSKEQAWAQLERMLDRSTSRWFQRVLRRGRSPWHDATVREDRYDETSERGA